MSRIIKFRAWDKIKKEMYWNMFLDTFHFWYQEHGIKTEDLEIMQFTGLLDKNGKEIYEGDIVKHLYHNEIVTMVFNPKQCGFQDKFPNKNRESGWEHWDMWPIDSNYFEIISNIYENPELLKESVK